MSSTTSKTEEELKRLDARQDALAQKVAESGVAHNGPEIRGLGVALMEAVLSGKLSYGEMRCRYG